MDFAAGGVVVWTELAHELHTHHHARRHGPARPLPLVRVLADGTIDDADKKARIGQKLIVIRGLQDGTVLVRHPDGSDQEVHPALIAKAV